MEVVEAAVAHHQYVVSGPDEAGDLADEGFYVGADPGARAEGGRRATNRAPPGSSASASSAAARLGPRVSRWTPRRMVLERGSSTATTRAAPPVRARSASSVARIAVGWCAKSS